MYHKLIDIRFWQKFFNEFKLYLAVEYLDEEACKEAEWNRAMPISVGFVRHEDVTFKE
jgi:hypothetical protein